MKRKSVGLLPFAFLLFGCADWNTGPENAGVVAKIDGEEFNLQPKTGTVDVRYSIENQSRDTVYVTPCGDHVIVVFDRWSDGHWAEHVGGICLAVFSMAPVPFPPGETIRDVQPLGDPGFYRLRIIVSRNPDDPDQSIHVTSQPFAVN